MSATKTGAQWQAEQGPASALDPFNATTDWDRVRLMKFLADRKVAVPMTGVREALEDIPVSLLARTIANAANEGLMEVSDEALTLTPFGHRVMKSF